MLHRMIQTLQFAFGKTFKHIAFATHRLETNGARFDVARVITLSLGGCAVAKSLNIKHLRHSPSGHWCLHILSGSHLPRIVRKWSLRKVRGRRAGDEGVAVPLKPTVDRINDCFPDPC